MRLPRRTPFADAKREIPQLYSLLYPPQSLSLDEAREARAKGIERVHDVYLVRAGGNTCPVAIECTASLLSALTMDLDASATIRTAAASLAVRQSLSLALIRLVNSLVDSLQSGAFARSIAHIAEQDLKLPLWLVEFRHRATHEGLPGLQNCREAVAAVSRACSFAEKAKLTRAFLRLVNLLIMNIGSRLAAIQLLDSDDAIA